MNVKLPIVFFLFFSVMFSYGQETSLPQNYFINPIDIPLSLSGNFGELRDNHFHSGLDIRTQQRTGIKVKATADGYISRLKTGLYGYGNVLYIQHPNGYTTVYGHLLEFSPKIREYVRKRQYAQEKNVIELFPAKEELSVTQGEIIALSGNSGGSGGPHLHYEVRDGQQRPMNPYLFGIKITDNRFPEISGIQVYPQNGESHVNGSAQQQELHFTKIADGKYKANPIKAYGKLGFGVSSVDYIDNAPYTNGLYEIETKLNGNPQLRITFNKFSFAKSGYINDYIDYPYYRNKKSRIQKLFIGINNHMDMQIDAPQNGFIDIKGDADYNYEVLLKDFVGNVTTLVIPIHAELLESDAIQIEAEKTTDYYAQVNQPSVFDFSYHDVYIPKEALFEDTYLNLKEISSSQIQVHDFDTPLLKNITIGFDVGNYLPEDIEKLYVARVMPWGQKYYSSTYKEGKRLTTRTKTFGLYQLEFDTTAPTISPINFRDKSWVSELDFLKLKIKDDESGISTYRGTINGKFIVLEYDYKTGIIKYDFRDKVSTETENKLKVIVTDNVGNSTTYEATFFRKE